MNHPPPHRCNCMRRTVMRTSWTDLNPGRRFEACGNEVNGCSYFQWIDPPMCARSTHIIPGLLRRVNRGKIVVGMYKKREKFLIVLLSLLLVIILFQFVGVGVGDEVSLK
ncbi:hypothetical protein LguiA_018906 [Lonicera macranthoides]